MVERRGGTTASRVGFKMVGVAAALLWLAPGAAAAGGLEPTGPGFISTAAGAAGQATDGSGRVAVRVIDPKGRDVTAAVAGRGYLRWALERDGKAVDGAGSLRPGAYVLRLSHGNNELRSPVNVAPGTTTTVTIRPGVIQVVPGRQDKATFIFTAVPDNVSKETFARRGCDVVGPNVTIIRDHPAAGSGGGIYLPPGLYRLITEYGSQTVNTIYVRLRPGRAVSLLLNETGAHATHAARAPVFAGKCFF